MFDFSPISRQFLTIVCCKRTLHTVSVICFIDLSILIHIEIGNLLTLSYGLTSAWTTINFSELRSENSTFATGPLTLGECSVAVALLSFGGLIGNYAILPISQMIGIKHTIHLFGLPLIVS